MNQGQVMGTDHYISLLALAPGARFELATNWLTANCSTTELPRITYSYFNILESVRPDLKKRGLFCDLLFKCFNYFFVARNTDVELFGFTAFIWRAKENAAKLRKLFSAFVTNRFNGHKKILAYK